jgi:hypothetical protein
VTNHFLFNQSCVLDAHVLTKLGEPGIALAALAMAAVMLGIAIRRLDLTLPGPHAEELELLTPV